jgi:enamine deaminase RidA (YjgF/YER057c/UK114 family)
MQITRTFTEAVDTVTLSAGGIQRHLISARCVGEDPLSVFARPLPDGAVPVAECAFGGCRFYGPARALLQNTWPLTWVQGDRCSGQHMGGTQLLAVSGTSVTPVVLDGEIVGSRYEDADATYCHIGGILPTDLTLSRPQQARQVFERLEAALQTAGMEFRHVVRTWLYLDQLLDWYGEFNQVRTSFYQERGLFDHMIPASTGIGAGNPAGAALVAACVGVVPKHEGVHIFPVASPLQCPATNYRSSFSRAVELDFPDRRYLMVSGTASIGPDGRSVHQGDIDGQIALTMRVVEAILQSRGFAWEDVTRMVVYYEDIRQAPRFEAYCRARNLPPLPLVPAHAVVCRPDLLFEVELDAARSNPVPN